jgi:hypothetical protein
MVINGDAKAIAAAFIAARGEMNTLVARDAKGNYGRYTTLATIVEATAAVLAKHGLAVVQEVSTGELGVTVETWLVHESGATMMFTPLPLPLTQHTPQAVGSAITYGRRYSLAAICGLASDDDDGQAAETAQMRANVQSGTPTPKKRVAVPNLPSGDITPQQLERIGELGALVYPDEWPADGSKLAEWASKGAVHTLEELKGAEAEKLISALYKKMPAEPVR